MATLSLIHILLEFYSISYFTFSHFEENTINMLYTNQSTILYKYTQLQNYMRMHARARARPHTQSTVTMRKS